MATNPVNALNTATTGQYINRSASSTSYTVLTTDYVIAITSTSSAFTVTLLNTPLVNAVFVIKDESGAAAINNITVTCANGTTTIDGNTTVAINTNYGSITVYYNGTSYFIV